MLAPITGDYVVDKVNGVVRQDLGTRAGDIRVTVKNGVVTLRGKVASEAEKQTLENQIVRRCLAVNQVDNELMITPE